MRTASEEEEARIQQFRMGKSQSMKKIGCKPANQRNLPQGFEQSVIHQEFEIEKGGVELTELIELYQNAVEYYDSIGDVKNSSIYKQKIQFVFLKPHISKLYMTKLTAPKEANEEQSKPTKRGKAQRVSVENRSSMASNEQSSGTPNIK
mmetsp:Transcript_33531/g.51531  ORF Transcript_33531/g.51531 Transcript_33531/m.51531 type:complete len:149 (+) Transcript_33531:256-702(+)